MAPKNTRSLKEDFISRLSNNKQHVIALLFLFILPLILYHSIFLGGQQFLGTDVIQWRAGAESIIEYQEEHGGENPLWAPNMFSGMPSYVISIPSAAPNLDTVVKEIGGETHPLPFYWVLLGGLYLFFTIQGIRPFAAALGSLLIGFTTYLSIIIEAGHYNKFVAYAFIPWMFAGYYMISRSNKKWLGFFLFALAVTLELRANHPQVTYYFLYLLGFWWIYDSWLAYKKQQTRDWFTRTGLAVGAGILGILCSIDMYWQLYEYSQYTIRGGSALDATGSGGLAIDYAFQWSQGIGELLTLIIPGLFGGSSGEAYWGPKSFTSGPHYLGAIAFILALFGLICYRKRIKYLFFGVGSLTLLFSLGSNFYLLNSFMFNYIPYFNKFRTPEMWLIVTVFCFSILAVYGIEALFEMAGRKKHEQKNLYLPLGTALAIGLLFTLGSNALLSFEKPGERQQLRQQVASQNNVSPDHPQVEQTVNNFINTRLTPERKEMAKNDSIRFLVLVLLAGGLIVGFIKGKISKGYFLAGLLMLSAYDMLSVDSRYVDEEQMMRDNVTAEQLIHQQQQPADEFVAENINSGEGYPYRAFPLLSNPFNNAVPAYFYPSIGGYSGAKLGYYQDLIDNLLMSDAGGFNDPVLDMLNVKYITINQQLPFEGYTEVFNEGNQYVYRNDDVLPKAFFVDSVTTVSDPSEVVEIMRQSAGFDPGSHAIVETEEPITIEPDTAAGVSVRSYNAKQISLHTKSATDGFLVVSEVYYPAGWKAEIDGEPLEIYKTNYVLRGMKIPAGDHEITMTFEPTSNIWGIRIARFGHLLLLGFGIFAVYVNVKRPSSEE